MLHASVMLFAIWLITFVVAWIFPYAWRRVGLLFGALWGLTAPLSQALHRSAPGPLSAVASAVASPFTAAAAALGWESSGLAPGVLAVVMGIALGVLFAWTGYAFRLFR